MWPKHAWHIPDHALDLMQECIKSSNFKILLKYNISTFAVVKKKGLDTTLKNAGIFEYIASLYFILNV